MLDLTPPIVVDPCVLLVAPDKYDNRLLRFLCTRPKSNFKSLLMTSLRQKLIVMSNTKAIPAGLKDQECEKGSRAKCPPIPYIPVIDPAQDIVNTTKEHPMKIKLPDKTEIQVPIWHQDTKLLAILKNIEKMIKNQAAKEKGKAAKQEYKTDSEKSGKCKGMSSSTNCIPKKQKAPSKKSCQLCKEKAGPHTTHNTSDCLKFEKDGDVLDKYETNSPIICQKLSILSNT